MRFETAEQLKDEAPTIAHHYFAAALWSSPNIDDYPEGSEVPYDHDYCPDYFPKCDWGEAEQMIKKFIDENADDLIKFANAFEHTEWGGIGQIGHDLWLTRNGHGAGFWDRTTFIDDQDLLDRLSDAARKLGEAYVYVDGKIPRIG